MSRSPGEEKGGKAPQEEVEYVSGINPGELTSIHRELLPPEEIFVEEYLVDFDHVRAFSVAYPRIKSRPDARAGSLLRKPEVVRELKRRFQARFLNLRAAQMKTLREMESLAFSDVTDYLDVEDGVVRMKDLGSLPREKRVALKQVTETKDGITIKMHDKIAPLDRIGQFLQLWGSNEGGGTQVNVIVRPVE